MKAGRNVGSILVWHIWSFCTTSVYSDPVADSRHFRCMFCALPSLLRASPPRDLGTTARVNLVDLAGSERVMKSQTEGQRLKEGCAINESLYAERKAQIMIGTIDIDGFCRRREQRGSRAFWHRASGTGGFFFPVSENRRGPGPYRGRNDESKIR